MATELIKLKVAIAHSSPDRCLILIVVNLGWVELPKRFFSNPKKGELRHPSYPTLPYSNMPTQKLQRYSYEILAIAHSPPEPYSC